MLRYLRSKYLSRPSKFVFSRKAWVKIEADYNKNPNFFKEASWLLPLCGLLMVYLLFFKASSLSAKPLSRELPILLSIEALLSDESQYNGHRVVVSGQIESLCFQQGKMGSPYLRIVLSERLSDENIVPQTLEVITLDFPKARAGDQVLVQGSYHISFQKLGQRFERFIDADLIVLDEF